MMTQETASLDEVPQFCFIFGLAGAMPAVQWDPNGLQIYHIAGFSV